MNLLLCALWPFHYYGQLRAAFTRPTARGIQIWKSHIFVCREGLLFSTSYCLSQPTDLVRLWLHESQHVYGDTLAEMRKTLKLTIKVKLV